MAEKKFYIQRYVKGTDGSWKADGTEKSLEDDFGFARYKSLSGLDSRGKQKAVYSESYPESNSLRVYIEPNAKRENITSTLTVLFFGSAPELPTSLSVTEQIKYAEDSWHSFYDWMEGSLILWHDDYRQRKALFFVSDATEPTSNIKGIPYLQCGIKLTNVFGKSFEMGDKTIENWLKNGGKETMA